MSTAESSSSSLIESLAAFTLAYQNEDFAKASELAPALLLLDAAAAQADEDESSSLSPAIYECYIKALIQEEKFEEVLELWNPNNNSNKKQQSGGKKSHNNKITQPRPVPSHLEHLRIYALYRLERFEKSRELAAASATGNKQPDGGGGDKNSQEEANMVLLQKHLLAQSLFHLQQSAPAMELYQEMLMQQQTTTKGDDAKKQQQQLLTNLAAVASANATPYVRNSNLLESQRSALDALLEKLGQKSETDDDHDYDLVGDLAYNLATYEMLTSPTEVHVWQQVMQKAIQAVSVDNDNDKEAALMKSNLDWSSRFWNGNVAGAAGATNTAAVPMNQLSSSAKLVALTNRALSMATVHDGDSKTAANALRLVPVTENLKHLTPLQMRLITYNRALLQYRAGQYKDCRASCQLVLDSAIISGKKGKRGGGSSAAGDNSSASSKMIAHPTLDAADAAWWESRIVVLQTLCHQAEQAAASVVEKTNGSSDDNGNGQKDKDNKKNDNLLQTTLDKISKLPASPVRDSAVAYLQLHQAALEKTSSTIHDTIALLQSLPESMQQRRAVVATLASLHQQLNQPDQVQRLLEKMDSDNNCDDSDDASSSLYADFLMGQQQYQQAADLYQKAATAAAAKTGGGDKSQDDYLTAQARYIRALSFVDPQKAQELWLQMRPNVYNLEYDISNEMISGADLETRELPRLKASSHAAATRTTAATADDSATSATTAAMSTMADGNNNNKPKKNRDAVLRQRARKREVHIAQLDKKGLRHVLNPDPERWLPKYERSYNRRRRNRNQQQQQQQHKGAQGGISENDAAKLDVAARQAARNDPTAADGGGINSTSTAQTAVSTGGPRKGGRRR